ncbi:hypothetical protein LWF01_01335 [Saxibacter everestensis]|uniref:DUF8083 domain-containing protein n=1 Tax=Saxibacter everestensis TaxID=2909229 RepID=A0ABY8QTU6_9MICO|nr:hypothetical protein LWF01_01335 [Brevibacteriaceae bacterium ZFBP1038]
MGAIRRPYETYLRVFEPISAHPELDVSSLSVARDELELESVKAANRRLLTIPVNPMPSEDLRAVLTIPVGVVGDEVLRVCPLQEQVRSWHALDALEEVWPESVVDLVAPRAVRKRAASERASWVLGEQETRVFTRMATWEIPLSWFVAVHSEDDQVDETDDRVRVRTPLLTAQARAEWALEILSDKLPDQEVTAEVGELVEWLESFDLDSFVELDYGGLAEQVWPDPSSVDVHDGIEALGEEDMSVAAASYHRFVKRWQQVAALARAS